MKSKYCAFLLLVIFGVASCKTPRIVSTANKDDGKIEVIFIQVNDVYEIAPLENGKSGGMARVATLKNNLRKSITIHYW